MQEEAGTAQITAAEIFQAGIAAGEILKAGTASAEITETGSQSAEPMKVKSMMGTADLTRRTGSVSLRT